ncbi:4861_t:CDS:2 [Racocetra fulgida]|uniref:4861_t:CDS:1 n=1 Tax=Racocetra fulgida TaxID=60492 RepID=A0A9N9GF59_9GLOM|nr:4861_t:CDS:2 [Racocetra fulgida]
MYENPEEESWSTNPDDQEFMFIHDYLAATKAKKLGRKSQTYIDNKLHIEDTTEECRQFGQVLGNFIHNSHKDIEKNHFKLENPSSLNEYYNSFPSALTSFFHRLIESIEKQIYEVRKRKSKQSHRMSICLGNADMQLESLAAFAPLFPATGKNIYILSVIIFLESVSRNLQQYELFKHIASVNITKKNHYLAFDEALEQYGIKFVKQNLTSGLSNPVVLKQRIMAIQDERRRMILLYNEFVEDNIINTGNHIFNQLTETLWQLIEDLTTAFGYPDST